MSEQVVQRTQALQALRVAQAVRMGLARVRQEVAAGVLTIPEALEDPRAQSMPIGRLLVTQRGWGPRKVNRLLGQERMWWSRPVRDLTDRQRRVICEAIERS